jgi:hypothetical protein
MIGLSGKGTSRASTDSPGADKTASLVSAYLLPIIWQKFLKVLQAFKNFCYWDLITVEWSGGNRSGTTYSGWCAAIAR